jgi:hypothetical protein
MIDEQAIIELHPDLEDGLWLEWDTDGGATAPVRCSFCGEPVIEGYYNPRTGQYACRANLDFEAQQAYLEWLNDHFFDEEPEEE